MRFLLMYFFYAFGTCVSPRRIFFTPWAPVSCAGVFLLRVRGNRTCTFSASVFSYLHIVHFFWKAHFWTAPVETKITFLLPVYFGSTCFPTVKRTFNCFKIVGVSTGFGNFNIMVRRSEWNLALKRPFCRCFGIVLKHSMDTTRHVFCSRSVRISFERVCFRLHPASSLCYVQTFPNQTTYQETEGFWTPE